MSPAERHSLLVSLRERVECDLVSLEGLWFYFRQGRYTIGQVIRTLELVRALIEDYDEIPSPAATAGGVSGVQQPAGEIDPQE